MFINNLALLQELATLGYAVAAVVAIVVIAMVLISAIKRQGKRGGGQRCRLLAEAYRQGIPTRPLGAATLQKD